MFHAIILGDPHLGKNLSQGKAGIGSHLNSRLVDQLNLLDWTLDQAIEYHVNNIIITGDIFEDPKPPPSLIALFISWLKKCQSYHIHIHIIVGNHDILRSGHVYSSPLDIIKEADLENINVYQNINTILIGQSAFTFLPFRDRKSFEVASNAEALNLLQESLSYELASIPLTYKKVLVGHLAIEGSIPVGDEIDDLSNELFCDLNMFHGYDYVWMGHVHKSQIMKKENPFVAHIGSMDISNFGETDQRKHIIIFNCYDASWEINYLPTRPLKKISLSIAKEINDPTTYLLKELKKIDNWNKSIVKIEITLLSSDLPSINKTVIEKYLTSQGVFNIVSISESRRISLIKKDDNQVIDTKMDVSSAIKTYAEAHVDVSVRAPFIELCSDIHNIYKMDQK